MSEETPMDITKTSPEDESSDSDSSDEEEANELKIKQLQASISENPYMYDNHVELIKLLRETGDLDRQRSARQAMREIFPLAEDLWLQWLKDEISCRDDDQDRSEIIELFENAVQDYLSVPIWLEYVQYSIGGMAREGGIEEIRRVFERSLTAAGLHVSKGHVLWEAYREFETAILGGLQPGGFQSKEQQEAVDLQIERITALFKRQLAVPLLGMKSTFGEYKDWVDQIDKHVKTTYDRTIEKLQALQPFEEALQNGTAPCLEEYLSYIEHEEKKSDPARIQCIYERAIQENCLIPDLWIRYTNYLDTKLKIAGVIMNVYDRAIRNCPWSVNLWIGKIRAMERHNQKIDTVKDVIETALNSGFTQAAEYLSVWTAYIDFLRRRIDWEATDHVKELEQFHLSIERAIDHLTQLFGNEGDPTCSLQRYWAFIEVKFCKNMTKSREIWNDIMQRGNGNKAEMWMEFIRLERAYGDSKHIRKVFQRAINSANDWPELVCEAYINYEREEGTLENFDIASQKCEAQLARIADRRAVAAEKEAEFETQRKNQKKKAPANKKQVFKKTEQIKKKEPQTEAKWSDQVSSSRITQPKTEQDSGLKRKHEEMKDEDGFAVPQKSLGPPPPGFKGPPPPGFKGTTPVESKQSDHVSEPPEKKLKEDEPVKFHTEMDDTSVFVSNLLYNVDEEKIRQALCECGEIKEIRLVKNFKGKSKGFAYVQFKTMAGVENAFKLDRKMIDGRPMFISPCKEKTQRNKVFKYSTNLEKNKLFVKNLPFTCTREALHTIFSQHGEVKDVRLVTHRSGAPKGLAYIEYVDETEAKNAVLKTDELMIGDHKISVAISQPPDRKTPLNSRPEPTTYTPSLGGGKKESATRGKAHTALMLMPRSVQRKPEADKETSNPSASTSRMSNADFRNMLLKK
ncbi:spliceosome associated factor 3, U4/U6 recycling protein-like [Tubulanus polymorphus]|uniref:spliceosome associated factor 3, U4/U6 recycling protein-like n=1 Tax=Tubulanus polymorphus TaxID=672921 RepID=UPI003DA3910E